MASNTDKARKSYSFLQKSLGGSIGDSDSSLTLNNYTNIPTDTAVDFIIDRIDANGNRTNDKRELVTGVCTGSAITGLVRGLHGTTAQAHDGGAIVEFVASGASWNDLIDAFLEEHNQDGTHDDTKIVKTSGAQTIAGVKTFSSAPVVPNGSWDTAQLADGAVTPVKRSGGFALVSHVFDNSTGSQSITGIAFKPKAIIVNWGLPSSTSGAIMSNGRAVDGSPIVQSSEAIYVIASGPGTAALTSTSQAFLRVAGSGTPAFAATVTSFNDDGITVDVTTTDATASNRTFQVLFMG